MLKVKLTTHHRKNLDCGRDQQAEQTLNSKCKAIKLVTIVKSCSLVKFFHNKSKCKIHLIAPLVENFNGVKLGDMVNLLLLLQ
ncbi:unnamed protein product, partial [Vitis vinifera]|uniref:Uncharacterized protein n=1 Tax=Vitis vinifera TaxID=29760 RepID=D7TF63_VITVI